MIPMYEDITPYLEKFVYHGESQNLMMDKPDYLHQQRDELTVFKAKIVAELAEYGIAYKGTELAINNTDSDMLNILKNNYNQILAALRAIEGLSDRRRKAQLRIIKALITTHAQHLNIQQHLDMVLSLNIVDIYRLMKLPDVLDEYLTKLREYRSMLRIMTGEQYLNAFSNTLDDETLGFWDGLLAEIKTALLERIERTDWAIQHLVAHVASYETKLIRQPFIDGLTQGNLKICDALAGLEKRDVEQSMVEPYREAISAKTNAEDSSLVVVPDVSDYQNLSFINDDISQFLDKWIYSQGLGFLKHPSELATCLYILSQLRDEMSACFQRHGMDRFFKIFHSRANPNFAMTKKRRQRAWQQTRPALIRKIKENKTKVDHAIRVLEKIQAQDNTRKKYDKKFEEAIEKLDVTQRQLSNTSFFMLLEETPWLNSVLTFIRNLAALSNNEINYLVNKFPQAIDMSIARYNTFRDNLLGAVSEEHLDKLIVSMHAKNVQINKAGIRCYFAALYKTLETGIDRLAGVATHKHSAWVFFPFKRGYINTHYINSHSTQRVKDIAMCLLSKYIMPSIQIGRITRGDILHGELESITKEAQRFWNGYSEKPHKFFSNYAVIMAFRYNLFNMDYVEKHGYKKALEKAIIANYAGVSMWVDSGFMHKDYILNHTKAEVFEHAAQLSKAHQEELAPSKGVMATTMLP